MSDEFALITKYTRQDENRIRPHLTNWMKTHAYIKTLNNSPESMLELRKMISIELNHEKRAQLIMRLRSRYINIRRQLEDRALFSMLQDHA